PMGSLRGFALPLLVRLYVGSKRGGKADAPSRPTTGTRRGAADAAYPQQRPTKLEFEKELVGKVAQWAPDRELYFVCDSAYAARTTLEQRPANVHVVSRLRMDAALWTPPPPRRPGQQGRPRKRGRRLPTPRAVAAQCRQWHTVPVTLYGRTVHVHYCSYTALWYQALRDQPVRIVVVRDPTA